MRWPVRPSRAPATNQILGPQRSEPSGVTFMPGLAGEERKRGSCRATACQHPRGSYGVRLGTLAGGKILAACRC